MTWHCWAASTEAHEYSFRVIGDSTGGNWTLGEGIDTSKGALEYCDWDVIVLQPYWFEVQIGYSNSVPKEQRPWKYLDVSVPYMLDYVETVSPGADVYLFFPWVMTQNLEIDTDLKTYNKVRGYIALAENYTGTETGKGFKGVIPIGTAIQNARTTYMALQTYVNPDSPEPDRVYFESDPVHGLQRDGAHVTYSVGRYIAALTFTETVVPEEMRVGDPTAVGIRRAPGSPEHPPEYKEVAVAAVNAALQTAQIEGDNRFVRTKLNEYRTDPTDELVAMLQAIKFSAEWSEDDGITREEAAEAVIEARLPEIARFSVTSVEKNEEGDMWTAHCALLYGYTEREFDLEFTFIEPAPHVHDYTATVTPPTCTEQGYTTYTCECGDSYVADYTDPLGHDFGDWVVTTEPTCTEQGEETRYCSRCDATETQPVGKLDHVYTGVVTEPTCTEQGYTTYTCECGDSYVADYTDALGHDWDDGVLTAPASVLREGIMTYTCLRCGGTKEETIPKLDETPDGKHLRILFIGNSYSEDITDGFTYPDGACYTGYSTLYNMLRTVTGGEVEIEIGLLMSGGKSMTWHASVAYNGYDYYAFRVVGDSTDGRWVELSQNAKTEDGLDFTDWDEVVLQPYGKEVLNGATGGGNAQMQPFSELSASVPFMLDYVETKNPGAEIFLYLPIANARRAETNAAAANYEKTRTHVLEAFGYAGAETGKTFTGLIPVGTAIQNARSTYMAVQEYVYPGAADPTVVNYDSDPIMGLQRDELHVSYSVGRYIAALTFVKTAVPQEMLTGATPLTVSVRRPDGAPALPEDYKTLANAVTEFAVASNDYKPVDMKDFKKDPTDKLLEEIASERVEAVCADPAGAGTEDAVVAALTAALPDNAVLTLNGLTVNGTSAAAEITLLYGYTSRTATVEVAFVDHLHEWGLVSSDYAHDDRSEYTETYVCAVCGETEVRTVEKTPCPGAVFTDMPKASNWAHAGIDFALENGLMVGMSQTTFVPAGEMTRAMLVTVLWRAEGKPEPGVASPFTDVKAKWALSAVAWAYENDIVKGTSSTTFTPDAPITREQIATILYRFTEYKGGDVAARAELTAFPDGGTVSKYAREAVSWAVAEGIISGTKAGDKVLLDPKGNATRAQVATILMRYLEK